MNLRIAIFLGAAIASNGVLAFTPHAPTTVISQQQSRASAFALQMSEATGSSEAATINGDSGIKTAKHDFALLFDCDGVILETEELHRLAYNAAFSEFKVTKNCGDLSEPVEWSVGYYDILQNSIGGGIPKMRHYFSQVLRFESNEKGDPTTIVATLPGKDKGFSKKKKKNGKKKNSGASTTTVTITGDDIATGLESLIESIQTRKTELYKTTVEESATPRPGLVTLMDEALADESIAVGVCSASTKAAAQKVLECTLGAERVSKLDVCILGDDVSEKKPSPMIYNAAREKLGIDLATKCVVVEDSAVGLRAAKAAGMRCLITYTASTTNEDFYGMGADAKVPDLANNGNPVTLGSIFEPLREAFPSDKDEYPDLLVGLKDEPSEEEEEEYDEDDNFVWSTASDEGVIFQDEGVILSEEDNESDENIVEIVLDDDTLVSEEYIDVSIPYDATVELAYEASDKSMSFDEFKPKYLAQAIAEVMAKQEPDVVAEELSEPETVEESPVETTTPEPPPAPKPAEEPRRIRKPKLTQDDMGNFSM